MVQLLMSTMSASTNQGIHLYQCVVPAMPVRDSTPQSQFKPYHYFRFTAYIPNSALEVAAVPQSLLQLLSGS